ncbi:MAG: four helix bundle protein [Candidatus Magasanikbacteria bacterium CG11_big_fil_rev_8_21_14_0_20_43_7]|uniref:Four helix bundle protein n=1 Tax=Candidatus Magasanikbacteria bacterium CG11_big_fil_rev_8_21_14_0_20_43_7 TaxID=1974654 RepID=A0A2H0N271_9BACT|nr:MAG: four helix bundle protein [Candidatus Magasanikbacteria bacterium CG11_big_fil_rev_8_21_14_0_20_43_7]
MEGNKTKKIYDLEERTALFGEEVIAWCKTLPVHDMTKRLIPQMVAAGTSVGANYCEADCAESNKDFIHKMSIANKETKESKHFIRMLAKACPEQVKEARKLWKEAKELNLIFTTIIKNAKKTEEEKAKNDNG